MIHKVNERQMLLFAGLRASQDHGGAGRVASGGRRLEAHASRDGSRDGNLKDVATQPSCTEEPNPVNNRT